LPALSIHGSGARVRQGEMVFILEAPRVCVTP
jgi:hypothetical protein